MWGGQTFQGVPRWQVPRGTLRCVCGAGGSVQWLEKALLTGTILLLGKETLQDRAYNVGVLRTFYDEKGF